MFKHVLIPTDGSELASHAVDQGIALAASLGARVTFLAVTEPFRTYSSEVTQWESVRAGYEESTALYDSEVLAAAEAKARAAGITAGSQRRIHPHPYEAIIETAREQGCDLIAMASHGRRGMAAVLLGSQTMRVLTHSGIPVLVYR